MTQQREGISWGVLIFGLAIGIIGGLLYAWVVDPVEIEDITPYQLNPDNQAIYLLLVSQAYVQDGNLDRATTRLAQLGNAQIRDVLAQLADDAYLSGGDFYEVQAYTAMAVALGAQPRSAEVFSGTSIAQPGNGGQLTLTPELSVSPSSVPTVVPTSEEAAPTATATAIQIPANTTLKLTALQTICQDDYPAGRLEVYVLDSSGAGIPAIRVQVSWGGGRDEFTTGAKPQVSPGYADFDMQPDQNYTVTLIGASEPVTGISSALCLTDLLGNPQMPSYQLVFQPIGG
jgi:hypothetical protein